MSNLLSFSYQSAPMRVIERAGEPWFVAKDVCQILDLADVSMSLQRLDDDEKGTNTIGTLGGQQSMLTVSESGLYALIFTSRKPEAKAFRKWVTGTVLPSIRRTGGWGTTPPSPLVPPSPPGRGAGGEGPPDITARYIALLEERVAELKARRSPAPRWWTPDEDAELERLAGLGWGHRRIGTAIGRAHSSVAARQRLLRARAAEECGEPDPAFLAILDEVFPNRGGAGGEGEVWQ